MPSSPSFNPLLSEVNGRLVRSLKPRMAETADPDHVGLSTDTRQGSSSPIISKLRSYRNGAARVRESAIELAFGPNQAATLRLILLIPMDPDRSVFLTR